MAFLLGNFLDLKDSIEAIGSQFEQRILNLEVQNDLLRSQIMRLKVQQNPVDQEEVNEVFSNDEEPIMLDLPTLPTFENFEEKIVPPPTKKVWLGNGEEDHYVQILDKKFALPDYCFYDNEDDIFNEYNAKVCDEKQKKLDRKLSSQEDKKDEKYKSNFKDLTPDEESDNLEPIQDQKRGAEGSGGRPKKFKKFKESKNYREGKKYKDSKKDLNSEDNTEDFEENPKKEDYNQDNWKSEENSKKDEYNEDTWKSEENPKRVEYNRDHWKAEEYSKGFKDSKYFKEVNEELKKNRDPNEQEEEPKNIFNENSKDLEYPSINKNSKDTKFEKFDQNDYKYEKKEKRPRRPQEQNQYQEKGDKKTMKDNKKFRKNEDKENQPNKKNIR